MIREMRLVLSKNYTFANDAFDHAIALEPGYFEAWDRKADALNRAGQFSDALQASSRSLEINPNYIKGWINRGQILYNIGYYYEDIEHNQVKANEYYQQQVLAFEKAIELDPTNPEAWFNKGYALAGLKRYDEAIAAFDNVQSLDPKYPNLALSQKQATCPPGCSNTGICQVCPSIWWPWLLILIIIMRCLLVQELNQHGREQIQQQITGRAGVKKNSNFFYRALS